MASRVCSRGRDDLRVATATAPAVALLRLARRVQPVAPVELRRAPEIALPPTSD